MQQGNVLKCLQQSNSTVIVTKCVTVVSCCKERQTFFFQLTLKLKVKLFLSTTCVPALTLQRPFPAIYITFVGKGFCKWYTGRRNSRSLTGSKTYLDEKLYLLRSSDGLYILK